MGDQLGGGDHLNFHVREGKNCVLSRSLRKGHGDQISGGGDLENCEACFQSAGKKNLLQGGGGTLAHTVGEKGL